MFQLDSIKPGDVLTLKSHMAGYYQVRVTDVNPIVKNGVVTSVIITVDAWRFVKDEPWNKGVHNQTITSSDSVAIEKI